ncbi:MAG: TVP38/TMEM64 family protein [Anaerolineae bacterium]|nr:TVP38/TMEM64 family protein [Anaerolineae bacterium]
MEPKSRQRWINVALIVLAVGILATLAGFYFSQCEQNVCPSIQQFVQSFGPWAPLIFAVLYVLASPIPFVSTVLSVTAGLVFGIVRGALYTVVIATLSALVPFTIARRLGREWVESRLKGKRFDEMYERSGGSGGFVLVALMRLVPILPWEVQNYVAGLTKIRVTTFLLATLVGIIPATTSLAFLGSAASDPTSWQFYVAIGINVVAALIPIVVVTVGNRKKRETEQAQ